MSKYVYAQEGISSYFGGFDAGEVDNNTEDNSQQDPEMGWDDSMFAPIDDDIETSIYMGNESLFDELDSNIQNNESKEKFTIAKDLQGRIDMAKEHYRGMGYNDVQTGAIIGNLVAESNLLPLNHGDRDSRGVAQWRTDRFRQMESWAKSNNLDPSDLKTQLSYVAVEAEQRGDLQKIANYKDAGEAAVAFGKTFERPSEKYANWEKRKRYAKSEYGGKYVFAQDGTNLDEVSVMGQYQNSQLLQLKSMAGFDLNKNLTRVGSTIKPFTPDTYKGNSLIGTAVGMQKDVLGALQTSAKKGNALGVVGSAIDAIGKNVPLLGIAKSAFDFLKANEERKKAEEREKVLAITDMNNFRQQLEQQKKERVIMTQQEMKPTFENYGLSGVSNRPFYQA